ncbi:hypothetical protein SGGMMB4_01852 [Sodalis glossinidius str. 'morsitans']|uniref:Uncharacterized protein n=1 Tax=Sodalis glossinidius (strain morsitans) TaxID=343509 RepID=Q2NUW4_SODGM|nr:hypothetical protein [Sodalis glossinidius]BAE74061.1 hypothetical protein SG0786 [Sodalis glossinidius str. 'morsitans']CRL44643.1 hypothetical protein SGGMMB4_01852 [Sodalis glossinidius str. 'morsitans']
MMARLTELVTNPEGRLSTSDVIIVGAFLVSSLVVLCLESSGDRPDARSLSRSAPGSPMVASPALAQDGAPVSRERPMALLVVALAGGAGYWRGAQQARLVAQATLATRQAECEARQRQQAQATQQALETALTLQAQLQALNAFYREQEKPRDEP